MTEMDSVIIGNERRLIKKYTTNYKKAYDYPLNVIFEILDCKCPFNNNYSNELRKQFHDSRGDNYICQPYMDSYKINLIFNIIFDNYLDERDKKIIWLRYYEKMTYVEIGEILDMPSSYVRKVNKTLVRVMCWNLCSLIDEVNFLMRFETDSPVNEFIYIPHLSRKEDSVYDLNIGAAKLPLRMYGILYGVGVKTLKDLCNLSDKDIESIKGIGPTTLEKIKKSKERIEEFALQYEETIKKIGIYF